MSVERLGNHILAVANRSDRSVTNLQLQKVLFFTVGMSIRHDENEIEFFNNLYNNDFEKWRYGPVVPSLYFDFNIYGNRPIENRGNYEEDYERFNNLILNLLDIDVYRLVALSHEMDAWSDHEPAIMNGDFVAPYTFDEILRDFHNA